jgi:catechol 2,3-dioxygenase-like lactoylglutathione lyase family enzyme
METWRGRLIDHLHLHARDLEASRRFYQAALDALGIPLTPGEGYFFADELWVDEGEPGGPVHFAFQARDRAAVEAFHKAALAAGGRDNGAPGERDYHPGYYAAFAFDPDGNNVEAVHHGPHERSAESVHISW